MKKILLFTLISLSQFSFCGDLTERNAVQEVKKERKADKNENNCKKNCKSLGIGFCYGFGVPAALGLLAYFCQNLCLPCLVGAFR